MFVSFARFEIVLTTATIRGRIRKGTVGETIRALNRSSAARRSCLPRKQLARRLQRRRRCAFRRCRGRPSSTQLSSTDSAHELEFRHLRFLLIPTAALSLVRALSQPPVVFHRASSRPTFRTIRVLSKAFARCASHYYYKRQMLADSVR